MKQKEPKAAPLAGAGAILGKILKNKVASHLIAVLIGAMLTGAGIDPVSAAKAGAVISEAIGNAM